MLKSTHKPATPQLQLPQQQISPLPNGWTEHKAPTGHVYYYNTETKQSTYTRPSAPAPPQPVAEFATSVATWQNPIPLNYAPPVVQHNNYDEGRPQRQERSRRDFGAHDRPKTKHTIPSCSPWLLVKTKLGRRFVHNPQTGESYWKFPKDVMQGVVEFDIERRKEAEARKAQAEQPDNAVPVTSAESTEDARQEGKSEAPVRNEEQSAGQDLASDEEYEEVEVTDDEEQEDGHFTKRQKLSPDAIGDNNEAAAVSAEMGEDDMAWQLAQMQQLEEEYEDTGEAPYEDMEEIGEDAEDENQWTDADAQKAFWELLDDLKINPYSTWDAVVEAGDIIEDDRYVFLPTSKARRDAFGEWSTARAHEQKRKRDQQAAQQQDPRSIYLSFLHKHASPKLFWAEFRRKFKKEPELKGTQIADKERESLYREHISRISKISESRRMEDLRRLLKDMPASSQWNRDTAVDDLLPGKLTGDVRWISLPASRRDEVVRDFVTTLPAIDEVEDADDDRRQQRRRREEEERALAARSQQAAQARRRTEAETRAARHELERSRDERERALRIGRGGLLSGLDQGKGQEKD